MDVLILTHDARWKGLAPTVRRAAMAALGRTKGSVTVVLTGDAEIKELNAQYRGKNKPTNVLSFPDGADGQLGDVVLAYDTIVREAEEQRKGLKDHLTHLTVHGVLHLMGYDHEKEKDARRMESLEIKLLATLGIANPYEAP